MFDSRFQTSTHSIEYIGTLCVHNMTFIVLFLTEGTMWSCMGMIGLHYNVWLGRNEFQLWRSQK